MDRETFLSRVGRASLTSVLPEAPRLPPWRTEDEADHSGLFRARAQAAAAKWVDELGRARQRARRLAPGTYMELRYEDLVEDPEPLLRRIAEFVDLPWDPGMLEYHHGAEDRMKDVIRDFHPMGGGTITAEERKRQHELVSRPPSSSRVGRWRTEMSDEDRRAFEDLWQETMGCQGSNGQRREAVGSIGWVVLIRIHSGRFCERCWWEVKGEIRAFVLILDARSRKIKLIIFIV